MFQYADLKAIEAMEAAEKAKKDAAKQDSIFLQITQQQQHAIVVGSIIIIVFFFVLVYFYFYFTKKINRAPPPLQQPVPCSDGLPQQPNALAVILQQRQSCQPPPVLPSQSQNILLQIPQASQKPKSLEQPQEFKLLPQQLQHLQLSVSPKKKSATRPASTLF